MIDDTIKAYCVLGVGAFSSSSSSSSTSFRPDTITHVLRFDPHAVKYPTGEEEVGWRGAEWMTFEVLFIIVVLMLSVFWFVLFVYYPKNFFYSHRKFSLQKQN